jgi:hypothetical protein
MGDDSEFDDTFLALPGFRVLAVTDDGAEPLVGIETIHQAAGCPACGMIARAKNRRRVIVRDLPVFNRRFRLSYVHVTALLQRARHPSITSETASISSPSTASMFDSPTTAVSPTRQHLERSGVLRRYSVTMGSPGSACARSGEPRDAVMAEPP